LIDQASDGGIACAVSKEGKMTATRLALAATSTDTLLSYALYVDPDPLQVNAAATLTLVVSNGSRQAITCSSIRVTLPAGTNAKDLIPSAAAVETQVPPNWSAAAAGGVITLTPSGDAGTIKGESVTFVVVTKTNGEPGTATVTIDETASSPSQPSDTRTTTIPVAKFPIQFRLSDLIVTDPSDHDVPAGGAATLMWTGQGDLVSYTMEYQPADDEGSLVSETVGSTGPYTTKVPLTRSGSVTFTLTASLKVPGQDQPLIVPRQQTVSVETLSLDVIVGPPTVGVNGLVKLHWDAPNADHCTLEDGTPLPPSGTRYFVLRNTRKFTVTAIGLGDLKQQQFTVTVDPNIKPTENGYVVAGNTGKQGCGGRSCSDDRPPCHPTSGEQGQRGGDAILRRQLPPLDTIHDRPARVLPIAVTGGRGGPGGDGGARWTMGGQDHDRQPQGPGGSGGDAILDVTLDARNEPAAQYIIQQLSAGAPGDGGGASAGNVSATIDGSPVIMPA
jgi:hypothetical protein